MTVAGEYDELFTLVEQVAPGASVRLEADRLDSRDLIAAQEEAQDLLDDGEVEGEPLSADERADATKLIEMIESISNEVGENFLDGESFILRRDFAKYCEELAEDCGMIATARSWPMNHIDWEAAAKEAEMDYTEIRLGGTDYLFHS